MTSNKQYVEEAGERRYVTCTTAGPCFVWVKEGRIVRSEPIQFETDEVKSWTVSVDGKTYRPPLKWDLINWGFTLKQWVYSSNRVKYPMKRVDWDPNGERNAQNRGKSGYERITWEEAFDILESETKRLRQKYGPSSIACGAVPHPEWGTLHYLFSDWMRFWNILGGTVRDYSPVSWDGWIAGAAFMHGFFYTQGILPVTDLLVDVTRHTDMVVIWGGDPISKWAYQGLATVRIIQFWKKLGKRIVLIEPYLNDGGLACCDKWIPINPGTDAALAAAIAYEWIEKGSYDQDYLDTHTIGFDEMHLPKGAPAGSSFKSYILGVTDGIPKTVKWAEKITGVPSRIIKSLASEWAEKTTSLQTFYSGANRRAYGHEWTRFMITLLAMQGIGKPGVGLLVGIGAPYDDRQIGVPGYADGGMNYVAKENYENPVKQILTESKLDQCILRKPNDPPIRWHGGRLVIPSVDHFFMKYEYPMKGQSEVHMIWMRGASSVCGAAAGRYASLYQHPSIETVVIQTPWFERDCKYADLVLPVTTNMERNDISEPAKGGEFLEPFASNLRIAVFQQKCIEPVGESKTDLEILTEMADRMGIKEKYTEGNTEDDWLHKLFASAEDIPLSYEAFKEKGYYVFPHLPDYDEWSKKQLQAFYEEPEYNPLPTPSGKIEIFSSWIFERYGSENPEIHPVPHYIPEWEGVESKQMLKKFPLQLLTSHPKFRFHGKFDDVPSSRDVYKVKGPDGYGYEPIVMNTADAAERGLDAGDIVRVFNNRGQILNGVFISKRIKKGVVVIEYGSWYDLLEPENGAIDRSGNANFLTTNKDMSAHWTGLAANSCLVQVERADLHALAKLHAEGWSGKYRSWNRKGDC